MNSSSFVIRDLHFYCVNLKTVTQAEQKASSLAGWLLCCWFCVPANVLTLWRWLLETSSIILLSWSNCRLYVSCKCARLGVLAFYNDLNLPMSFINNLNICPAKNALNSGLSLYSLNTSKLLSIWFIIFSFKISVKVI